MTSAWNDVDGDVEKRRRHKYSRKKDRRQTTDQLEYWQVDRIPSDGERMTSVHKNFDEDVQSRRHHHNHSRPKSHRGRKVFEDELERRHAERTSSDDPVMKSSHRNTHEEVHRSKSARDSKRRRHRNVNPSTQATDSRHHHRRDRSSRSQHDNEAANEDVTQLHHPAYFVDLLLSARIERTRCGLLRSMFPVSVSLARGFTVQTRLNGSSFCLWWRLLETV